jgi:hypothetical protein
MRCRSDNSFRTYLLVPKRTSSEGGDRFVIPCLNDANTTKSVSRHLSWETRPICFFWGFSSLLQFRRGRRFIVVVGRETISNKQTEIQRTNALTVRPIIIILHHHVDRGTLLPDGGTISQSRKRTLAGVRGSAQSQWNGEWYVFGRAGTTNHHRRASAFGWQA